MTRVQLTLIGLEGKNRRVIILGGCFTGKSVYFGAASLQPAPNTYIYVMVLIEGSEFLRYLISGFLSEAAIHPSHFSDKSELAATV